MTTTLVCPDDTDLLALAIGEPVSAAIKAHADGCSRCRTRREQLKAEVASLRQNHGHGTTPPSTEQDPAADNDGERSGVGTTEDWTSAGPAESPGPDPLGPEAIANTRGGAFGEGAMPDAIGRYKVVGWIDCGGEADVYRVVHINLGNNLVLKLSRRRVSADNQSGLIELGRLLIDLEHPNLVRIHDLDFHDDRPFLVMEFVHGRNLEQYAGAEHVTPRRAAALVAKLAKVIAVAHKHGITHCDIKPKNVLIDKLGEPRLIDFGMARMRHAWLDRAPTSWGGTVAYMAPEQARMEFDRIGPRSDIFALGGVLYFLLTGRPPFVGETGDELWDRARRCDFEAGALRAAKVPRRLEHICLKALAADPPDRYSSADEMANALDALSSRPGRLALQAGAFLLVAAIAVGGALWSRHSSVLGTASTDQGAKFASSVEPLSPQHSSSQRDPKQGEQETESNSAPRSKPAPGVSFEAKPLRIDEFHVELHRRNPKAALGRIGLSVFEGQFENDDARIRAQLSSPAFCYLIALNADGTIQLCHPGDASLAPLLTGEIDYPKDPGAGFGLTDGVGLQAFVLVASRKPLPPFADWRRELGELSWKTTEAEGVWHFDGRAFETDQPRGDVRPLADLPRTLEAACLTLRSGPGVEAIRALAFQVKPIKSDLRENKPAN